MTVTLTWTPASSPTVWLLDGSMGVRIGRGVEGLERPVASLELSDRVGADGAVLLRERSPARRFVLPLLIDETRVAFEAVVAAFRAGTLTADRGGITGPRPRQLRGVIYEAGLEGEWSVAAGGVAGQTARRVVVSMLATDPWWYGPGRAESLGFGAASTPWNPPEPWNAALPWNGGGSVSIDVEGDAPASPYFDVYGPVSDVTVSISAPSLVRRYGWRSQYALAAGQRLTVDHRPGSRGPRLEGAASVNWALLTAASRLFTLPVGSSSIVAGIVGSSGATEAVMYWEPRWLTP